MKKLYSLFLILVTMGARAQNSAEIEVNQSIENFFQAFHTQDSVGLKNSAHANIVLQTIGKTKDGAPLLKNENYNDFVDSMVSIPDSINFQERILDYSIQID